MQAKQKLQNSRIEEAATQYSIQRAEARDEQSILQLLERYVTTQNAAQRYQWIYKRNPQGRAETWLAIEPRDGQIVGFTGIFAREFQIGGNSVMAGVGFDAFVRPDHRRRGIALALHRASQAAMAAGEVPFRFMCGPPVRANLNALIKAGSQVVGGLRYLSMPFTARGLMSMLHFPQGAKKLGVTARLVDQFLARFRQLVSSNSSEIAVKIIKQVDHRFDGLWQEMAPQFPVIGRRDASYLNWRYLQNPVCWQQLIALEYRGSMIGWAALEYAPHGCLLVDYLLPYEGKIANQALSALLAFIARRGVSRVSLRFNLKGHYTKLFCRHGFLPGWSVEHLQVLCTDPALLPFLLTQKHWHFSNGDLNPESSPWRVNTAPQAIWTNPDYISPGWPERSERDNRDSEGRLELHPGIHKL